MPLEMQQISQGFMFDTFAAIIKSPLHILVVQFGIDQLAVKG